VIPLCRFLEQAELRDSLYPLLPVLLSGLFTVFVLAMQSLADLFSNRHISSKPNPPQKENLDETYVSQ
jgi:hypothetical protein